MTIDLYRRNHIKKGGNNKMDKVKKERYEQAVYLKMSMYLALEFLKNIPEDMQGDYVIGQHRKK